MEMQQQNGSVEPVNGFLFPRRRRKNVSRLLIRVAFMFCVSFSMFCAKVSSRSQSLLNMKLVIHIIDGLYTSGVEK